MKMTKYLIASLFLCFTLASTGAFAQETEKAENPKKELKKLLKSLPQEELTEILKYAKVRKARMEAKAQAEAKTAAQKVDKKPEIVAKKEESVAAAQPVKKPVSQAIDLSKSQPASESFVQQKKETEDNRPAHIKKAEEMAPTSIKFNEKEFDFGEIKQGEVVTHTFTFKNTGENPLKITKVKPSCGCTASDFSKEEIAPGKEGFIKVSFNSAHKKGQQRKSVTVYGNTNPIMKVLYFKGNVIVPAPAGEDNK